VAIKRNEIRDLSPQEFTCLQEGPVVAAFCT